MVLPILRSVACFIPEKLLVRCRAKYSQCDEKKPVCTPCARHAIDCDFVIPAAASAPRAPARQYRFRRSKYQQDTQTESSAVSRSGSEARALGAISTGVQCDLAASQPPGGISFADLRLYHHYMTTTYKTLSDEAADANGIYLNHLPQWGIAFPSILHLILSLSALHLASKNPDARLEYFAQADAHFTFGVRSVTAVLALLNSENCQLIYQAAALICLTYFGRGPRPAEYLVFSQSGQSQWLVLLRGVRSIVMNHHERIFTGVLTPVPDDSIKGVSPALQAELDEHLSHIGAMETWIKLQVADAAVWTVYESSIQDLKSILREAYAVRSAGKDGISLMHLAMGWVYRMQDEMIAILEARDPYALVVYAHWSIILRYMRSSWLMRGWDEHVVLGVHSLLPLELHQWIAYPVRVVTGREICT
ncbi:Zn(II)2Cys6 transcription factor [Aspergillus saccharolyticus JOP 1030-1]|uniref:Zn(2)-C6 fungal-type domain-containing protein n=1 Tax=Aspergillus saccharolyticus JOP 1030-1 TaxID=1450539 RepID=A0A318Z9F8_9EURO|nr:hypothetical protein BP01DRAFT_361466 [Aspergillus saccharolyticus JOP 1030-1]PYH40180.1 hypothetical protein BP01DRAFT_361466 [Aspergillus saccharolyticus JOP 1030-1]